MGGKSGFTLLMDINRNVLFLNKCYSIKSLVIPMDRRWEPGCRIGLLSIRDLTHARVFFVCYSCVYCAIASGTRSRIDSSNRNSTRSLRSQLRYAQILPSTSSDTGSFLRSFVIVPEAMPMDFLRVTGLMSMSMSSFHILR